MEKNQYIGVSEVEYAPFIRDDGAKFLFDFCKEKRPQKVLEIGTFLGYSGSLMLKACEQTHLYTIEIDKQNFKNAKKNFEAEKVSDRVTQYLGDAKDVLALLLDEKNNYDLIFLDGPKGQYIHYLPTLLKLLNIGGYLIADNVYFHGLVNSEVPPKHKHRSMVLNLRSFLSEITSSECLQTEVLSIADGISVSKRIK